MNLREFLLEIPADHPANESSAIDIADAGCFNHVSITQNSNLIANLKDLIESVRDIYHPHAVVPQPPDHGEEIPGLVFSQCGCWFVQDEETNFAGQCLRDLDNLSL